MSETHPRESWISCLPLNGLNLQPATQITNGNIRKLHERLQPRQNRKTTKPEKNTKEVALSFVLRMFVGSSMDSHS